MKNVEKITVKSDQTYKWLRYDCHGPTNFNQTDNWLSQCDRLLSDLEYDCHALIDSYQTYKWWRYDCHGLTDYYQTDKW